MKMQNQAKLAAGHRGHMAKHMSKCLRSSATAKPAEACTQLPFGGGILLGGEIWICSLKFHHPQKCHHPSIFSAFAT